MYLQVTGPASLVDISIVTWLLPLWESAELFPSLVERWQKLRPVHPVTGESTSSEEAFDIVKQALAGLEESGYVLLEHLT